MSVAVDPVDLPVPGDVRWICDKLESAGHSAWTVGGAVRDALAGSVPEDWDVATSARPGEVRRIFRRTVPIGVEHGTVGVIGRSGQLYEVTTFRRDVETFGRRARVVFAETIDEDLARRDFTINAVAWHPATREVRDPYGGVRDRRAGLLRTVGEPAERFAEDRLRVLRALRFAGRFQLRIDAGTWTALKAAVDELHILSAERVREELWKVLSGQQLASASLRLYGSSGVLRALYPELDACRGIAVEGMAGDLWEYLMRSADSAPRTRKMIRVAALLHCVAGPVHGDSGVFDAATAQASAAIARELLRRLKASNAQIDTVTHLIAMHAPVPAPGTSNADLRRWLRPIGRDRINDLFRLLFATCRARYGPSHGEGLRHLRTRVNGILRSGAPLDVTELAIGGEDLRRMGIPPGPRYGQILRTLLEVATEDPGLNSSEALTTAVREMVARASAEARSS